MYLMRIGPADSEKPVVRIDDTHYVDVSDVVSDFDEAFFGSDGIASLSGVISERVTSGQLAAFAGERIGAPIARPHKILCIGLNYSDHAAETVAPVPDEPILFTKSPNTLIGPNDDVRIPRGSTKPDWEVELGIVIARRSSYLDTVEEAKAAIAGFTVVNDVSERAFQIERGGQWSVHSARTRRPDQHRNAPRRRHGSSPTSVAKGRRRHGTRHRESGQPTSARTGPTIRASVIRSSSACAYDVWPAGVSTQ
jgi:2,4-didehydro-3-deoxy-L-rhamnonate hydrolase